MKRLDDQGGQSSSHAERAEECLVRRSNPNIALALCACHACSPKNRPLALSSKNRSFENYGHVPSDGVSIDANIAPRRSFTSATFVQDDDKKAPFLSSFYIEGAEGPNEAKDVRATGVVE